MSLEQVLLKDLLHNPVVVAALLKIAYEAILPYMKKVDSGNVSKQGWLKPASVVLSVLATALSLASTGHLASLDLTPIKDLILALIGVNGVGTDHVKKMAVALKAKLDVSKQQQ